MKKRSGILLVNLGTPKSPKLRDVWNYLIEFLTDPKVIDYPWLKRQLLVRGLIVPLRYKETARQYAEIWTDEGSPLMVYGRRVQAGLQELLGPKFLVELAMRYQELTIESQLRKLSSQCDHIKIIPLFPQYTDACTGSIEQKVAEILSGWEGAPEVEIEESFPTLPGMIDAFAEQAEPFDLQTYDHVLFSFHGLPERQLKKLYPSHCRANGACCEQLGSHNKNCYAAQCYATAAALRSKLALTEQNSSVTFQSRLGRDPWIQPFTDKVIEELARKGAKRLLVFSPAFVCDCLETLFEIKQEYAKLFQEHGGKQLDLVPGLNDNPTWIRTLATFCRQPEAQFA